jgi:hypothetical protein
VTCSCQFSEVGARVSVPSEGQRFRIRNLQPTDIGPGDYNSWETDGLSLSRAGPVTLKSVSS